MNSVTDVSARRKQLARIHLAKKQLALDDTTYRSLLLRVGGHESSANMTPTQRNAVLREFSRLGFKSDAIEGRKRTFAGKPKNHSPLLSKVEALLTEHKRPWAYAHALAKRMFGTTRVEWLTPGQLHKLVAALQIDANRQQTP